MEFFIFNLRTKNFGEGDTCGIKGKRKMTFQCFYRFIFNISKLNGQKQINKRVKTSPNYIIKVVPQIISHQIRFLITVDAFTLL